MTRYWDFLDSAAQRLGYGAYMQTAMNLGALFGLGAGFCLLRLGDFTFAVTTAAHQQLERTRSFEWEAVKRLGRKPARQYVADGDDVITLSGVIFTEWSGRFDDLDRLAALAGKRAPMILTDHFGRVMGEFCVQEIRETQQVLDEFGRPRKIEFSVSLGEYGSEQSSALSWLDVAQNEIFGASSVMGVVRGVGGLF